MSYDDDDDYEPEYDDEGGDDSEGLCVECSAPLCEGCALCHECNCDDVENQWCVEDFRHLDSIPEHLRVSEGL